MAHITEDKTLPQAFAQALRELSQHAWRPEVRVDDIPAPQRVAPFSAAISADVIGAAMASGAARSDTVHDGAMDSDRELGNGRLVLLHDPAGNEAWEGTFRLVSFARADVEPEMVADPLLPEVGWSWLVDALGHHGAAVLAPSGTVTSVASRSFGSMADDPARAEIEIRASWTPVLDDGAGLGAHLCAWDHLLCTLAGLPPLPEGVVTIPPARRPRMH